MKSLATKTVGVYAALLLGVCGAALVGYGSLRLRAASQEAVRLGVVVADAFGVALEPLLERADFDAVGRLVRAAGESPLYDAVALVARDGRVVAADPALPARPDPGSVARCARCHRAGPARSHANLLESRDGGRVVQVFRALGRGASCTRCHRVGTQPPGYIYLEIPVSAAFQRFRREAVLVSGIGVLTILILLFASHRALSILVAKPLSRIRAGAERILAGEPDVPFAVKGADELSTLAATLQAASQRQGAIARDISEAAAGLQERGERAQRALGDLRQGVVLAREAAQAILESVGSLDGAMEQIRANLDAISGATSDNASSLTQMSASIDEVAGTTDELARQVSAVTSAVIQMVESIAEVADRADVLSRETERTASAVVQIDASTRQIEESARQAADLSGRTAAAADEGGRAVRETIEGIHASYGVIQDTARVMGDLADASQAIGGVVKIINEINDRTKLLSLNAAIIAAQAGEHGKSFGVVAHEIKNLSDRTAANTGRISTLVRGIQERIAAATEAVQRGEGATGRSLELAEGAGRSLERIRSTVQLSHDMTRKILHATEEQSRSSESVIAAMREVSALVAHVGRAAAEHRESGAGVAKSTEIMRDLTEQAKHATAEQAEVSRYLSDAVSAIDRNLQGLLRAVDRQREESENILGHMTGFRERGAGQEEGIDAVEGVIGELQEQIARLADRAVELLGGRR